MSQAVDNTELAEIFLRTALAGSAALTAIVGTRIYADKAPVGSAFPLCVFAYRDGQHTVVINGVRLATWTGYAVRVIDKSPSADASAIGRGALAVDAALANIESDPVLLCESQQPLRRAYTVDGIDYRERGGFYRLILKGAS